MGPPIGTTPVPFHTGGAGAIRTLDKAYHRLVRGGSITRLVSITHGDSLADNCPEDERPCYFNKHVLARIEAAFFPNNPATRLTVVPGTISVRSRPGDELSPLWTFETSPNFPGPSDIKLPPAGPLGPNGEVQPFPRLPQPASFSITGTGKRFIFGYIIEPGAGSLDVLVVCAGPGPVAALDTRVWGGAP